MASISLAAGVESVLAERFAGDLLPGLETILQRLTASAEDWCALLSQVFEGQASESPEGFRDQAERLRQTIVDGSFSLTLDLRSSEELQGAYGAYAASGSPLGERILLNADWAATASDADLERVLLEELGHAFDQRLTGGVDTTGDEGELFAARVLDTPLDAPTLQAISQENDNGVLQLDGQSVNVEFADPDQDNDGIADAIDLDDDNDGILDTVESLTTLPKLTELVNYSLSQNIYGYNTRHDAAGGFGLGGSEDPKLLFDGLLSTELKVHQDDLFEYRLVNSGNPYTLTSGSKLTLTDNGGKNGGFLRIFGTLATTDGNGDSKNATGGGLAWANLSSYFSSLPSATSIVTTPQIADLGAGAGKAVLLYQGPSNGTVDVVNVPIDIRFIQIVGLQTHGGFAEMSVKSLGAVATDTDGDGIANALDLDSDNDGISDLVEGVGALTSSVVMQADTDRNGTISLAEALAYTKQTSTGNLAADRLLVDATGDGVWDFLAPGTSPVDSDKDGVFNFVDLDSDADGIPDTVEARASTGYVNNPGYTGTNDADRDGVIDLFDASGNGFGGTFVFADASGNLINTDKDGIQGAGTPSYADATSADATADNVGVGSGNLLSYGSGAPDNRWVEIAQDAGAAINDRFVVDLGSVYAVGTTVSVRAGVSKDDRDFVLVANNWNALTNATTGGATQIFAINFDGLTDTQKAALKTSLGLSTTTTATTLDQASSSSTNQEIFWKDWQFTLTAQTRYLAFSMTKSGGGGGHYVAIDSVAIGSTKGPSDSIPDYLDTDSDNDGFTDVQEAGTITTPPSYADPDGSVGLDPSSNLTNLQNTDKVTSEVDFRSAGYDVQVTNVDVNEAGGFAYFRISGPTSNTNVYLSLGVDGDPSTKDASGTSDYSTTIQVFNTTSNTWVNYTAGTALLVLANGEALARVAIVNDNPSVYEGPEAFRLIANYGTGLALIGAATNVAEGGYATIFDNGTGSRFVFDGSGDSVPTQTTGPGAGFDDDRTVTINDIAVNEGSKYGVFTLTGPVGVQLTLSLQATTNSDGPSRDPETEIGNATLDASGSDVTQTLPNSLWYSLDGNTWTQYNSSSSKPTIPASGIVYVRVGVQNDSLFEGREQFRLVSTHRNPSDPSGAGGAGTLFTSTGGIGTIRDDGNGDYWLGNLTDISGGTAPATAQQLTDNSILLDDDHPLNITNLIVNEGSGWAVFDIDGPLNAPFVLTILNGSQVDPSQAQTDSADYGVIEWWNGSGWIDISGQSLALDSLGRGKVRVQIKNDTPGVYEGPETFTLKATNTSTNVVSEGGEATIVDDGTGQQFSFATASTTQDPVITDGPDPNFDDD